MQEADHVTLYEFRDAINNNLMDTRSGYASTVRVDSWPLRSLRDSTSFSSSAMCVNKNTTIVYCMCAVSGYKRVVAIPRETLAQLQ